MTPEIDAIKTTIRQLRVDLVRAERELADAYGPRVDQLADVLLARFSGDELRRLLRSLLGADRASELPASPCSPLHLARAGAVACLDAGLSRDHLFYALLRERPRCGPDIEAGLKDWGAT